MGPPGGQNCPEPPASRAAAQTDRLRPSDVLSAYAAEHCPGTKKPDVRAMSVRSHGPSSIAGHQSAAPGRPSYPTTHATTCQTQHKIPAIREIAVAAAHAEARTAVTITTRTRNAVVINRMIAANIRAVVTKVAAPMSSALIRTPAVLPANMRRSS